MRRKRIESSQAASCFDSLVEQTTDAPPRDDTPNSVSPPNIGSNIQITEGIQWNDGVSSVQNMVTRPPMVTRSGSIAVSAKRARRLRLGSGRSIPEHRSFLRFCAILDDVRQHDTKYATIWFAHRYG